MPAAYQFIREDYKMIPTPKEAFELLKEYNKGEFHLNHGKTVGAVVLMRPSKSVSDLELKSVKKKYKNANFAAGCSREVIERGADMLGWTLDDLISKTILAMRSCENS